MTTPQIIEGTLPLDRSARGRRARPVETPGPTGTAQESHRVLRVARLLALAHRLEHLVATGAVRNHAELARLGHVSYARISQIMNLLLLAPDIQEQILFWSLPPRGRDPIHLRHLQPIAANRNWHGQRRLWSALLMHCAG